MDMPKKRLIPNGECWCGCGEDAGIGSFFKPGHDKRAESMLLRMRYGSVAGFLDAYGFGPGRRNLKQEYDEQMGQGK